MTLADDRRLAEGAVRSLLVEQGRRQEAISANEALKILDDLARTTPDLVAAKWYAGASEHQLNLFEKEWREQNAKRHFENAQQQHEKRRLALRGLQRYLAECALPSDGIDSMERIVIEYNGATFNIYCVGAK